MVVLGNLLGKHWESLLNIAQDGNVGVYNLVNLGGVNLQVDNLCVDTKLCGIARYAVIETHTDSDKQVAVAVLDIGTIVTVHTEHTDILRVVGRKCRQAEER